MIMGRRARTIKLCTEPYRWLASPARTRAS
jgi:hypothetical protein